MESKVDRKSLSQFRSPKKLLGELGVEAAANLIAAAADIALVLDSKGVIRDIAVGNDELAKEDFAKWVGQRWQGTVTVESQIKIEDMLREANGSARSRWRQVNHPSSNGPDVPVRYTTIKIGDTGRVIAVGRDLRALANLQQRLVESQQNIEREYLRLRHAESRYRMLFQVASEAVLIVDAGTMKVLEANPVSLELLCRSSKRMVGRSFPELFAEKDVKAVEQYLAAVRLSGRAEDVSATVVEVGSKFVVSASLFRQESVAHFLVRLEPSASSRAVESTSRGRSQLIDLVEKLPDGFAIIGLDRRIVSANAAFIELTQTASEEQLKGESLDRWIGRHTVDINVLLNNVKEHGVVRNFATVVRGEYGSTEDVEISAVSLSSGEQPMVGLTVRNVSRRAQTITNGHRPLPRSVEQLTELVGRVSLKDLVRESTDLIEKLCIEAALELTGDNRASAAEMLGLSRQGLYSKLRRYGIGDLDNDGAN